MKKKGKPTERCITCKGVARRLVVVEGRAQWEPCLTCNGSGVKPA